MISEDDLTKVDKIGLREHCGALDRDVAVTRISGWCMMRFSLAEMTMLNERELDVEGWSLKTPMTFITSPVGRQCLTKNEKVA